MKANSIKEYRKQFQPDVSLNVETAWTGRKASITKYFMKNNFWQFPNTVACQTEIFCWYQPIYILFKKYTSTIGIGDYFN
jgi:hypothetical protein